MYIVGTILQCTNYIYDAEFYLFDKTPLTALGPVYVKSSARNLMRSSIHDEIDQVFEEAPLKSSSFSFQPALLSSGITVGRKHSVSSSQDRDSDIYHSI